MFYFLTFLLGAIFCLTALAVTLMWVIRKAINDPNSVEEEVETTFDDLKGKVKTLLPIPINIIGFLATIFIISWSIHTLGVNVGLGMITVVGAMIWATIYIAWGLQIIPTNEYIVVERLGTFYDTCEAGLRILCLPGLIDRVPTNGRGTYMWKEISLYRDEAGNAIDFADGVTAPIKATIYYHRKPLPENETDKTKHPGYKWLYAFQEPEDRIEEVVDATLRPILEGKDFDDAKADLRNISKEVMVTEAIIKSLEQMGAELHPEKGLLLADIILSPEMIALRSKVQEGEAEAKKQQKQGQGYGLAIQAIIDASRQVTKRDEKGKPIKWSKPTISFLEAKGIYEQQRAMETVGTTGNNITFVSPDLKGVSLMLGVGGNNQQQSGISPQQGKRRNNS